MCQKLVNGLVVARVRANLDISLRAFEPFNQVGARRAEMQRLTDCALVHLGNHLAAMTLRQAPLTGFFRSDLPFFDESLRQFSVSGFCAFFEPPDLAIAPDAIKTGDPERTFGQLMCVFGN